ncbi:hypothetical protein C8R44DRAFT_941900 [Mycena epipterygia]|nr:hypothetical protein C8R44DRAFT_941900 [Mycena epipterygia]
MSSPPPTAPVHTSTITHTSLGPASTVVVSSSPPSLSTGASSAPDTDFAHNVGGIVGLAVGGVVFLTLAAIGLFFIFKRRRRWGRAGGDTMGAAGRAPPMRGETGDSPAPAPVDDTADNTGAGTGAGTGGIERADTLRRPTMPPTPPSSSSVTGLLGRRGHTVRAAPGEFQGAAAFQNQVQNTTTTEFQDAAAAAAFTTTTTLPPPGLQTSFAHTPPQSQSFTPPPRSPASASVSFAYPPPPASPASASTSSLPPRSPTLSPRSPTVPPRSPTPTSPTLPPTSPTLSPRSPRSPALPPTSLRPSSLLHPAPAPAPAPAPKPPTPPGPSPWLWRPTSRSSLGLGLPPSPPVDDVSPPSAPGAAKGNVGADYGDRGYGERDGDREEDEYEFGDHYDGEGQDTPRHGLLRPSLAVLQMHGGSFADGEDYSRPIDGRVAMRAETYESGGGGGGGGG